MSSKRSSIKVAGYLVGKRCYEEKPRHRVITKYVEEDGKQYAVCHFPWLGYLIIVLLLIAILIG